MKKMEEGWRSVVNVLVNNMFVNCVLSFIWSRSALRDILIHRDIVPVRPQLVEYIVLDILLRDNEEEEMGENKEEVKKKQIIDDENDADVAKKYRLADDVVARVKDIGNNDTTFQIRTHLGRILKPDDHALGYDLSRGGEGGANTNTNNNLHAAILITKISYAEENGRVVAVQDKWESDYQLFLNYLQQDPKLIFNVRAAEIKPKATHMLGPS
ncbi:nonsense-mediated mRNA decay protein [Medicago truncatula]|uniref:Nonsense-mediated mRNA decay protein n=1 Tax=Medicago truncatula TaxID=3880 RepID=A0A072UKZ6_MEDTR|nr:nonsense-mediated mRNA decay protein [Medicago truncatula]